MPLTNLNSCHWCLVVRNYDELELSFDKFEEIECAVVKVLFSSNFLMRPCSMYLKSAFFDAIKIKLGHNNNNKQK